MPSGVAGLDNSSERSVGMIRARVSFMRVVLR
jgi:hypothetical protein